MISPSFVLIPNPSFDILVIFPYEEALKFPILALYILTLSLFKLK